jgi:hypothetical protein
MEDTKCFEKKFQEKELILQFFKRFMYFFFHTQTFKHNRDRGQYAY